MGAARSLLYGGFGFAAGIAAVLFVEKQPTGTFRVDTTLAKLEQELQRERARTLDLEAELARLRAQSAERDAPPAVPSPADAIPPAVRATAAAWQVSDDALKAAFDAARDPKGKNLTRLRNAGVGGFRGLVAVLREGGEIAYVAAAFAASWDPSMAGEERALIDVAESADLVLASKALMALGFCDTTRTREYLVWKLRGDSDGPFVIHACAEALGRLREPSALPELARAIRNGRAPAPQRATALFAIADIGGAEAKSILVDYVREPGTDGVVAAVLALQRVDREAAREEALALLAGPRQLSAGEREQLEYAGKR